MLSPTFFRPATCPTSSSTPSTLSSRSRGRSAPSSRSLAADRSRRGMARATSPRRSPARSGSDPGGAMRVHPPQRRAVRGHPRPRDGPHPAVRARRQADGREPPDRLQGLQPARCATSLRRRGDGPLRTAEGSGQVGASLARVRRAPCGQPRRPTGPTSAAACALPVDWRQRSLSDSRTSSSRAGRAGSVSGIGTDPRRAPPRCRLRAAGVRPQERRCTAQAPLRARAAPRPPARPGRAARRGRPWAGR